MLSLIVRKKTFSLALAGLALAALLVWRVSQKPPASQPLVEPARNPFGTDKALAASGIVESKDENIRLAPAVSGLVKQVYITAGQSVKTGEVLLELDDRQLLGQWKVQKAVYEKLNSRYAKIKSLGPSEALSREEKDTVKHDWLIAAAEVAKIELLLDQLKLKAPVDGVILQLNTRKGEFISTPVGSASDNNAPAILLGQSGALQVRADVDEVNAYLVKPQAEAKAFLKGGGQREAIDLKFVRIEPYVIPKKSLTGDNNERVDTRVLQVIFSTDTQVPLYVGQQLDVYIRHE